VEREQPEKKFAPAMAKPRGWTAKENGALKDEGEILLGDFQNELLRKSEREREKSSAR